MKRARRSSSVCPFPINPFRFLWHLAPGTWHLLEHVPEQRARTGEEQRHCPMFPAVRLTIGVRYWCETDPKLATNERLALIPVRVVAHSARRLNRKRFHPCGPDHEFVIVRPATAAMRDVRDQRVAVDVNA